MSIVTISEVQNSVTCSKEGKAEHVFNIKNTTDGSFKVGAQILAKSPTKDEWLTIEGIPTSNLDVDAITQISVKIAVPKDCKPDNYSFRLRIFDPKSPGERFSEGDTVYFTVLENEAVVEKSTKKCNWCIPAAVAAGVLIVAGVTVALLLPGKIVVPKLTGMTYGNAVVKIATSKLSFDESKNRKVKQNNAYINKVISQQPAANTEVDEGTNITLVVGIAKPKKGVKIYPTKYFPVFTKQQMVKINKNKNIKVKKPISTRRKKSIAVQAQQSKVNNVRTQVK